MAADAGLKGRWAALCQELDVASADQGAADRWWQVVQARYRGKGRAYHTLEHLAEMFGYYDEHAAQIQDSKAVRLAIFFHDIVYDPKAGSPQNERDSALLFERFGQEALPAGDPPGRAKGELMTKVFRWIVQTAHHRCEPGDDPDCKLFMDFDMAVLGRPWPQYEEYSKLIRREYSHVPEPAFCLARKRFLEATAGGPPIYSTEAFRESREQQARENAAKEAAALGEKLDKCSASVRFASDLGLRFKFLPKALQQAQKLKRPKILAGAAVTLLLVYLLRAMMFYAVIAGIVAGLCYAVKLLALSPYIAYPYPEPTSRRGVAVIAGSYNPPHAGHLEMIRHLSKRHATVHAVIGVNPNKKYDVNAYERQELLKAMIAELEIKNVKVVVYSGIIFVYARSIAAKLMYRGIRTWAQDGRAEKYLEFQNVFYQFIRGNLKPIPTAYLQANPTLTEVSSTVLRKRIAEGQDISDIVPPGCAAAVARAYSQEQLPKTEEEKKAD